jgi:hypothetical protein
MTEAIGKSFEQPIVMLETSQDKGLQRPSSNMYRTAKVVAAFFAGFIGSCVKGNLTCKGTSLLNLRVTKIAGTDNSSGYGSFIFNTVSFVLIFSVFSSAGNKILDLAWKNYKSRELSDAKMFEQELQRTEVADPEKVRSIQEKQQQQVEMKKAMYWGIKAGLLTQNYQMARYALAY